MYVAAAVVGIIARVVAVGVVDTVVVVVAIRNDYLNFSNNSV